MHNIGPQHLHNIFGPFIQSYQQFSRKTGLSDSTLHRLELRDQNITLKTLEQLCDRFKCSISDLFED
jgi:DNA-binding Xre family transcriptional regulator